MHVSLRYLVDGFEAYGLCALSVNEIAYIARDAKVEQFFKKFVILNAIGDAFQVYELNVLSVHRSPKFIVPLRRYA